jgi:predicted small metal-binding protein
MHVYNVHSMSRFYYACKDVGFDCSYHIDEPTHKDLWNKIRIHNRYAHNQFDITPEWEEKINKAIQEK